MFTEKLLLSFFGKRGYGYNCNRNHFNRQPHNKKKNRNQEIAILFLNRR